MIFLREKYVTKINQSQSLIYSTHMKTLLFIVLIITQNQVLKEII